MYSMVHYEIKLYTLDQAKKYGYIVMLSTNEKKELDVYRKYVKVASIGDSRYKDYPTYIGERGLTFANTRRALYHKRHKNDIDKEGSPGYLSSILLW